MGSKTDLDGLMAKKMTAKDAKNFAAITKFMVTLADLEDDDLDYVNELLIERMSNLVYNSRLMLKAVKETK